MKLFNLILIVFLAIAISACGGAATETQKADEKGDTKTTEKKEEKKEESTDTSADTPTKAIEDFVKAYNAKDVDGIKKRFSKATLETMQKGADAQKKELDDMLKQFMELGDMPFKDTPEMRNEKIDGDKATVEVNAEGKWESTPLVKEDGMWKLDFQNMKK